MHLVFKTASTISLSSPCPLMQQQRQRPNLPPLLLVVEVEVALVLECRQLPSRHRRRLHRHHQACCVSSRHRATSQSLALPRGVFPQGQAVNRFWLTGWQPQPVVTNTWVSLVLAHTQPTPLHLDMSSDMLAKLDLWRGYHNKNVSRELQRVSCVCRAMCAHTSNKM